MKFHASQKSTGLDVSLTGLLQQMRKNRNFNAKTYIEAKTIVINDYFRKAGLKGAVVAVSGGIDSAVVLSLLAYAKQKQDSPITTIIPLAIPIFKSKFTTNQNQAEARAKEVIQKNGLQEVVYNLTDAYDILKKTIDSSIKIEGEPWAAGQLVSYLRTPAIYYTTSLLNQQGCPALVCGTTNRDEGSYLGFVGKASDGMVDLQIISDLHKSEVRSVAKLLGVPKSILNTIPTGDMFDGRVDEDVFGASYDFVELFLLLKAMDDESIKQTLLDSLPVNSKKKLTRLSANVEDLHRYNSHKYLIGSPAVHLDVLESGVPDGWTYGYEKVDHEPKGEKYFVNNFSFTKNIYKQFDLSFNPQKPKTACVGNGELKQFGRILQKEEVDFLLTQADAHGYQPVGIDGYASNYTNGDPIGSYRASTFSPALANVLWYRISQFFDNPRIFDKNAATDTDKSNIWRPIGISPLFRYIKYTSGGLLVPHYDAPYIYSNKQRTLMSLVIYLDAKGVTGGETRFIKDKQVKLPFDERNFNDWTRFAKEDEILFEIVPKAGAAISFDHRILHDSSKINGKGQKVIMRTDIVFTRC